MCRVIKGQVTANSEGTVAPRGSKWKELARSVAPGLILLGAVGLLGCQNKPPYTPTAVAPPPMLPLKVKVIKKHPVKQSVTTPVPTAFGDR